MKNLLQILKTGLLFTSLLLITTIIQAQTVTYDGSTANRPLTVNGLVINGTTYNVVFTYNVLINGTTTSGLSVTDANTAQAALITLLNAQGIISNAQLAIVTSDAGIGYNAAFLQSITSATWNATSVGVQNFGDFITTSADIGIASFVVAPPTPPSSPIPTMSQWGLLIFGLLIMNLGVFLLLQTDLSTK